MIFLLGFRNISGFSNWTNSVVIPLVCHIHKKGVEC